MQGQFGPQRDPHRDWINRMEKGAAYEEWKKGRQGSGGGAGEALGCILFLGFVILIIAIITSGP